MDRLKKIPYIEFYPMVLLAILTAKFIFSFSGFTRLLGILTSVLTPFIWAFAIAFIANPLMKLFEKKFKVKRLISILVSYAIIIGAVSLIITLIVPIIALNVSDIVQKTPEFLNKIDAFLQANAGKYQALTNIDYQKYLEANNLQGLVKNIGQYFGIFSNLLQGLVDVTSGLIKFLMGMIISIYILLDKERFALGIKKALYAVLGPKKGAAVVEVAAEANDIFARYLIGQATDSCVVAILAFIGFVIIKAPYAMLLAIIIGITNMIPYFGPIIGLVPVVILIAFTSPMTALYALVFILVLQQIDGNIIAPRIVGGSVGVTPFWSILAIVVGGYFFGVAGMVLCVPTFALLRNLFVRKIEARLEAMNVNLEE